MCIRDRLALVVWMVVQARRHLRSRSRRWLLYPVIGMLTVAAVGGGYETVSAATDAPPATPGRSIDVGGHSLHLNCTGTGSPCLLYTSRAHETPEHLVCR